MDKRLQEVVQHIRAKTFVVTRPNQEATKRQLSWSEGERLARVLLEGERSLAGITERVGVIQIKGGRLTPEATRKMAALLHAEAWRVKPLVLQAEDKHVTPEEK